MHARKRVRTQTHTHTHTHTHTLTLLSLPFAHSTFSLGQPCCWLHSFEVIWERQFGLGTATTKLLQVEAGQRIKRSSSVHFVAHAKFFKQFSNFLLEAQCCYPNHGKLLFGQLEYMVLVWFNPDHSKGIHFTWKFESWEKKLILLTLQKVFEHIRGGLSID